MTLKSEASCLLLDDSLFASECLKSILVPLPTYRWVNSIMGTMTGHLSGNVGIGVRSVVEFSGPVGGACTLKAVAVLCINTGVAWGQESQQEDPIPVTGSDFWRITENSEQNYL